jgi:hypothetical protein
MDALGASSTMDIHAICLPRGGDFVSERSIKNTRGKGCQTLIQVKFTRAHIAVEGSAPRFGTAGDLVTAAGASEDQLQGPWKEDRTILGAGNPAPGGQCEGTQVNRIQEPRRQGRASRDRRQDGIFGQQAADDGEQNRPRRAWRKIRGIAGRRTDGRSSRCGRQARGFDRHRRCSKTDGGGRHQGVARAGRRGRHADRRHQGTAERIAKSLRIDGVFADVLPGDSQSRSRNSRRRARRSAWSATA